MALTLWLLMAPRVTVVSNMKNTTLEQTSGNLQQHVSPKNASRSLSFNILIPKMGTKY